MIDESLIKKHSIGQDGFTWWLGQVCEAKTWAANYPVVTTDKKAEEELPGFKRRVKVSILGYHTESKEELKNDELPWAYCLMPTSAGGGSGGFSESLAFSGGEWVFGFFLDGEDGQQPVIIGLFDKSAQEDFRNEVPPARYEPFSGYTNQRVVPLGSRKDDENVDKSASGGADIAVGTTGVKRTGTKTESATYSENEDTDLNLKGTTAVDKWNEATGDTLVADNSDTRNPMETIEVANLRLSKVMALCKEYDGYFTDVGRDDIVQGYVKYEQKRCANKISEAQKTMMSQAKRAQEEAMGDAFSNIATVAPLSKLLSAKVANNKSINKIINVFNSQIAAMPSEAMSFVKQSSGRMVSQPPCVVESYTGALLGKTLGGFDSAMTDIMSDANNIMATVDKAGSLAQMGLGAAKALQSGGIGGLAKGLLGGGASSLLTGGLNALGGISIPIDGLPKFKSSYKKLFVGHKPLPPPEVKRRNISKGGAAIAPTMAKMGGAIESFANSSSALTQLSSGISNFTQNNSIFSTAVNLAGDHIGDLGGLGAVTDVLSKAKNLQSFKDLPGTIGDSVFESTKTMLDGGATLDAALQAADVIYPGSGSLVKGAFEAQKLISRDSGGGCETGPSLNGPPLVEIYGGGGTGATANAVVGKSGSILAIQMTRPGKGYQTPPFVVVNDPSGLGRGCIAHAHLSNAELRTTGSSGVIEITIDSAGVGYIATPDGSVGGQGISFAKAGDTVIKDKQGNYYAFEPGTGIKIPPGGVVYLPAGTKCQVPTSTIKTDGESVLGDTSSRVVNYAAIRFMHTFDTNSGDVIIPGPQGAEGKNKPGFGAGNDLKRAKEEGYSDADIRFFLEGDPNRGKQGYFVTRMNGAIGRNMQKLLDNPKWGQLPVMSSGGKNPGRIKSLQIDLKKGFKGYSKVTDGSRLGAGPVLSLRDAVTDRKISNVLERQTGIWLNVNADLGGNTEIIDMFKQAELVNIEGRTEEFGKFGTAGRRTWAQTRQEVGAQSDSNLSGGGLVKNILGEQYRTLDPWRADLADGTRLTFRGAYNHNTGLTKEQMAKPYDLSLNNYRYFVFDYVVEVYSTPFGYSYAAGNLDPVKTKWYKLIDIKYVTGTEDWFNGETVLKRCQDKAGRLYELNIKVCTYDDETTEAIGQGLATNSEGFELVKTPLPCAPKITKDKWADYRPTRWYREKNGERSFTEQEGHIPGTERNILVREIVKVYNEYGDKDKARLTDFHNAEPYKYARKYVDKKGLSAQVEGYLRYLKQMTKGISCETEEYTVPGSTGQSSLPIIYENLSGLRKHSNTRLEYDDNPTGGFDVNGAFTIESTTGGVTATFNQDGTKLDVNGTGTVTLKYNWNDIPGYKSKALDSITISGTKWTQADVRRGTEIHTIKVNSVSKPATKKTRAKKITPLSQEEYTKYRNNLNQKPHPAAFACLKKDIWKGFIAGARKAGPIVKEEHYCEWATQFVDEVRKVFRPTTTIGYELPCGGEITAPSETPTPPPTAGTPTVLKVKDVIIGPCGSGYNPGDSVMINGIPCEPLLGPNGEILGLNRPNITGLVDYPVINIESEFGSGADIECTLEVDDTPPDGGLLPSQMVEVIDCVGKNIFIKES